MWVLLLLNTDKMTTRKDKAGLNQRAVDNCVSETCSIKPYLGSIGFLWHNKQLIVLQNEVYFNRDSLIQLAIPALQYIQCLQHMLFPFIPPKVQIT